MISRAEVARRPRYRIPVAVVATYLLVIVGLVLAVLVWDLFAWSGWMGLEGFLSLVEVAAWFSWGPALILVGVVELARRRSE